MVDFINIRTLFGIAHCGNITDYARDDIADEVYVVSVDGVRLGTVKVYEALSPEIKFQGLSNDLVFRQDFVSCSGPSMQEVVDELMHFAHQKGIV